MSGMPARSAAARSAVMFSMHSRRRASAPGMSNRFTHTHAASRRTAWPIGVVDDVAEGRARRLLAVDVGDVDAQHERGLVAAGERLQQRRLAERELDRVGPRRDQRLDHALHVLDAGEEARLAEERRGRRRRRCSGPTWRGRGGSGGRRRTRADHRHGRRWGGAWKDPAAVVIAGPNLTIDRTLSIDELRPGEVLRFERAVVSPGGKGVNVARVARELGAAALLVGFVPGRTGAAAAALLADEGLTVRGVEVGGELRSTAVVLERSGRVTVFNEPGPPLAPGDWERYEAARGAGAGGRARAGVQRIAAAGRAGRMPTRGWSGLARGLGALAVVDVGGGQLAAARGRGRRRGDPEPGRGRGAAARARRRDRRGRRSRRRARARAGGGAGARGARRAAGGGDRGRGGGGGGRWRGGVVAAAGSSRGAVRNPIGAGDALVGGLALALERGEPFAAAVSAGMACGAASVETDVAGVVVPARVAELLASARSALRGAYASPRGSGPGRRDRCGRPPRAGELPEGCWLRVSPATPNQHAAPERPGRRAGLPPLGDAVSAAAPPTRHGRPTP